MHTFRKYASLFSLFLVFGAFLVFAYKNITQTVSVQQLKTPPTPASPFSLNTAPSDSLRGTITFITNEVDWQSRVATVAAQITAPQEIQQGEALSTKDKGQVTVTFENILQLFLSPNTQVDFLQILPVNIVLGQDSGTAQYSKLGNSPVSIRSLTFLTTIKSGEISVSVSNVRPLITVDTSKGAVTIGYNDTNFVTQTLDVPSGNMIFFNTETKNVDVEAL